jgi:hypothetical protein
MNRLSLFLNNLGDYLSLTSHKTSLNAILRYTPLEWREIYQLLESTKINNSIIEQDIENILTLLEINAKQKSRFKGSITVFQLLKELQILRNENAKLQQVLDQLKIYEVTLEYVLKSAVVGFAIILFLLPVIVINLLNPIILILSLPLTLPLLGCVVAAALFIYSISELYENKQNLNFETVVNLILSFVSNLFLFASYLCVLASFVFPVLAFLAPLLYVGSSAIDALRDSLLIAQLNFNMKEVSITIEDKLRTAQNKLREQSAIQKTKNDFMINFSTSIVLLALALIISFMPGGAFLTIGTLVAMGTTYAVRVCAKLYNKSFHEKRLQKEFENIEKELSTEESSSASNISDVSNASNFSSASASTRGQGHPINSPFSVASQEGSVGRVSEMGIFGGNPPVVAMEYHERFAEIKTDAESIPLLKS